jgi:transcriptional regulator with XRE-family HTH domain
VKLIIGPMAKRLRQARGLKQGDVAKSIGTSAGNLSRFENGNQGLSLDLLTKLSSLLGTTPNELISLSAGPSDAQEIAVLLNGLSDSQLSEVKGFIAAKALENK